MCLSSGSYEASLNLNQNSYEGSHFAIPDCDVYLTPLVPKQDFLLDNSDISPCKSSCHASDHKLIQMFLFEENGAGWTGHYYFYRSLLQGTT